MKKGLLISILLLSAQAVWAVPAIDDLLKQYDPAGKMQFSAERGDKLWHQKNVGEDGKNRDCSTCHGADLRKQGKHVKSGKVIEPLSAAANSERFTDMKKVEKWFKRNCKWTYGRECTTQEKGDILAWLAKQ